VAILRQKIEVRPVRTKAEKRIFLTLSKQLHRNEENWIFPLDFDAVNRIDKEKNPFFEFGEAEFFVAYQEGNPVGRISAQVNQRHLECHDNATGHFGYIDACDSPDVFKALLTAAEQWLVKRGMRKIVGPFDLSINEESGLLVDGFDTPPMIAMTHACPYHGQHLEAAGYEKVKDLQAFLVDISDKRNERLDRMLQKSAGSEKITIRPLNMSRYDEELEAVMDVFCDAWSENWGFIPFTDSETKHLAKAMKPIIQPEIALIAEIDGDVAGIMMAAPNINEAIADFDGKLFPFGWAKFLWRLKVKGLKTGRVMLAGVRKKHHGTMLGMTAFAMLLQRLIENGHQKGYRFGELSWVLEDNKPVQRLLALGGYQPYKTYRLYEKEIS